MGTDIAHIVYASDDRFAEILGVSLVSLYENSKDMEDIIVYILDSSISNENREKLVSVAKSYKRTLPVFIKAKKITEELHMEVTIDRGSLSQYARLFISSMLPGELERVLYLDCDTIIRKSIKGLWTIDLYGRTIGALMDAFSSYYRINIDLEENSIMFNSGVMLIDLKKWKEEKVENRLLEFIVRKNGQIQQGDQGALNAVLSRDTYCFEPQYNSVTIFHDFSYDEMVIYRKPIMGFYSKEQVKEAVENPVVVHFTTSFLSVRPWTKGCGHRYAKEWMRYKEISPWREGTLWEDNRPCWEQIGIGLLRKMPRRVVAIIAGIAQAYGRPIWKRIRGKS